MACTDLRAESVCNNTPETTFDPLDWIARFEASGGGFAGMGDNKLICWSLDHPPAQLQWLKTLHGEIKNDAAKVDAVKAALSAREVHHD